MEDYLFLASHLYELSIHSFVLMPNHFHLLVTASQGNLSEAMNYFMRETSREVSRLSGRINQTYGGRNHKSLIATHHYFMNAYKYVYRNPVRAGLVSKVEHYPYSTLSGLLGLRRLTIPVAEDSILFQERFNFEELAWLNSTPEVTDEAQVRKALRKSEFHFVYQNAVPSRLETYRY